MTTQKQIRAAFWQGFAPGRPWRKRNKDGYYSRGVAVVGG